MLHDIVPCTLIRRCVHGYMFLVYMRITANFAWAEAVELCLTEETLSAEEDVMKLLGSMAFMKGNLRIESKAALHMESLRALPAQITHCRVLPMCMFTKNVLAFADCAKHECMMYSTDDTWCGVAGARHLVSRG